MEPTPTKIPARNPLRLIVNAAIWIFVLLLLIYAGLRIAIAAKLEPNNAPMLTESVGEVKLLANTVFSFISPFLQLVFILLVLEWLLSRFGFSLDRAPSGVSWNVQTIIALIVIASFSLAALSGVQNAGMLKDVALVIVGFYFGTQKKVQELTEGTGTTVTTITEEHTNPTRPSAQ